MSPEVPPDQVHPFGADRPIRGRSEDQLGRASFANALADAMGTWRHKDSLIVALYGSWGSGKSSIKNMAIERLQSNAESSPVVIEFNPWYWSGEDHILDAFFQEIAKGIDRIDKSQQAKELAAKWRLYGAYLKPPLKVAEALAAFVPILGQMLKSASQTVDAATEMFEARSLALQQSLEEQKTELKKLFSGLACPLVVVLDDVDRISPEEIRLLFRLVKANADFPNVVYLMLFQRPIVEKALSSSGDSVEGHEYLEKIVQVGFDVPSIERARLERILFEGIDKILAEVIGSQAFDQTRWSNIYVPGLSVLFQTIRDVRRFLSVFAFSANLFRGEIAFEVNAIDLIALETLRLFEPGVHLRLIEAKHALTTRRPDSMYESNKTKERVSAEINTVVEASSERHRESVQVIIGELFPLSTWVFGGPMYNCDFDEVWYRALRVCHPQVFYRYFHLAIPEGDVSQSDIQRVIDLAGDREALVAHFRDLEKRGLLPALLNRLEAYKQRIDIAHAVPFITALMDIGDDLPDDRSLYTSMGSDLHATRILLWYLRQEKDKAKCTAILREAIVATDGLYIATDRIAYESQEDTSDKEPKLWLVERDDLKGFQELIVEKIESAGKDGSLIQNRHLQSLLWRWREWAGEEPPKKWVQEQVTSDPGLLGILVAFTGKISSHGMRDYATKQRWEASLRSVEHFVPVEIIEKRLEEVSMMKFSPEQERAVRAFQRAFRRRKAGKPENGWPYDDDDDQ
jgi:predicted KAP-like P-loop ATPase